MPARRRGRHAARTGPRVLRRRRVDAAEAPPLQDRLDPRAGRRSAGDFRVPAAAAAERRSRGTSVGLTHISFNVRNLQSGTTIWCSKGVECVSKPERSPRGHSFFFAKDFDGNLIELMDLGYMYYVLDWLGPLGGWIFRRGMYKKYYEGSG